MGDIYRATDSVLGRVVAIKILAERFAQDAAGPRALHPRGALGGASLGRAQHRHHLRRRRARRPSVHRHGASERWLARRRASRRRPAASRTRLHVARRSSARARRGPPRGRRAPRRQARQPDARRRRQCSRRRLRNRKLCRNGLADDDRHRAGNGRLSLAGAGARRARRAGERPLCAGDRRVGASHRQTPLRIGEPDRGGGRSRERADSRGVCCRRSTA